MKFKTTPLFFRDYVKNLNYNLKKLGFVIALLLIIVPSLMLAQGAMQDNKKGQNSESNNSFGVPSLYQSGGLDNKQNSPAMVQGFCENLETVKNKMVENINRWQTKKNEIIQKLEVRAEERNTEKLENRARWDANRAQHFDLLEDSVVGNPEKIKAVNEFRVAVEEAIKNRRLATDQIMETFENKLKEKATSDLEGLSGLRLEFQARVETAFSRANVGCEDGQDPVVLRNEFKNTIQEARNNLKNNFAQVRNQNRNMVGSGADNQIPIYIAEKNQALQEAHSIFQYALVNAREGLLQAFGKKIANPDQVEE